MKTETPKASICLVLWLLSCSSAVPTSALFEYDVLNRLTNVVYSDGSRESYAYDLAGNRLFRVTMAPTKPMDITPPSVPTNFVSLVSGPSRLSLGWNRAFDTGGSGFAAYLVYTNGVLYAATTSTNLVLSDLLGNTPYSITLAASDRAGNVSAPSSRIDFFHLDPATLSDPGLTNGIMSFVLHGAVGTNYIIEASSNLVHWEAMSTNLIPAPGIRSLLDLEAPNHTLRFYRALLYTNDWVEPTGMLMNGSFEVPRLSGEPYIDFFPSSVELMGWLVGGAGGPVALVDSQARSADGRNYVSFNSGDKSAGTWLEQTFRTTPGTDYTLNFQVGRTGGGSQPVSMEVFVQSQGRYLIGPFTVNILSEQGEGFQTFQRMHFTATSAWAIVRFLDTTSDSSSIDLMLDNVSVHQSDGAESLGTVPSPAERTGAARTDRSSSIPEPRAYK